MACIMSRISNTTSYNTTLKERDDAVFPFHAVVATTPIKPKRITWFTPCPLAANQAPVIWHSRRKAGREFFGGDVRLAFLMAPSAVLPDLDFRCWPLPRGYILGVCGPGIHINMALK